MASSTSEALNWTDLVQDTVSTRTVNTQHGQSIILSFQKADGSCCSALASGMLTKKLLQNPVVMGRKRARLYSECTPHFLVILISPSGDEIY